MANKRLRSFAWQAFQHVGSSVAVLAEIPLRSPQKLFIFIIKKFIFWVKVSKKIITVYNTSLHVVHTDAGVCEYEVQSNLFAAAKVIVVVNTCCHAQSILWRRRDLCEGGTGQDA